MKMIGNSRVHLLDEALAASYRDAAERLKKMESLISECVKACEAELDLAPGETLNWCFSPHASAPGLCQQPKHGWSFVIPIPDHPYLDGVVKAVAWIADSSDEKKVIADTKVPVFFSDRGGSSDIGFGRSGLTPGHLVTLIKRHMRRKEKVEGSTLHESPIVSEVVLPLLATA